MVKCCRWISLGLLVLYLSGIDTFARADNPGNYFQRSYAVVIGIRDYKESQYWPRLEFAENDADRLARYLRNQGFLVKTFRSDEATKNALVSYLEDDLAPRLEPEDRLVFYFSGHGETRRLGGKDRGYIIPYDGLSNSSSWVAMEKLRELADKLGNARHQLFIFDACFGGLFATKSSLSSLPETTPNYLAEVTTQKARQYLTAGGAKERTPAQSHLDGYREFSHFTAHLLKGLEAGFADTYRDGVITASELDAYLGPAAKSQFNTPRGGNFAGHEQGNFAFLSPRPETVTDASTLPDSQAVVFKGASVGNQASTQAVTEAQTALRALGFVVGEEGKLDRATEEALLAFQSLAALDKTGHPDAATLAAIAAMPDQPGNELLALRNNELEIIIMYQIGTEPTVDALTSRLNGLGVEYTVSETYNVPGNIAGRLYFGQEYAAAAYALRSLADGLVDVRLSPSDTAGTNLRLILGLEYVE